MDRPWKAHERSVAEFFGTRRALHGLDRGLGEVNTDVFVDTREWVESRCIMPVPEEPCALVVECKFCDKSSQATNDWPAVELQKIRQEPSVKKIGALPVIVTRDGWKWLQIQDFGPYFDWFLRRPVLAGHDRELGFAFFEVRHLNREMSKFFEDAIQQARSAELPKREGSPFQWRAHVVCVGTNARVPKAVGIPPGCVVKVQEEKKSE